MQGRLKAAGLEDPFTEDGDTVDGEMEEDEGEEEGMEAGEPPVI